MSIRDIPAYGGVPIQPRAPKMVISSLLDATETNLEPLVVRTLDDFQKAQAAAGPDLRISADLYRAGSTREEKNKGHFLNMALQAGVGLAAGLGACFGIDPSGMQLLGMHFDAKYGENATEAESRIAHKDLPFADWKGHRTFVVDGGGLTQASSSPAAAPSAQDLRDNLASNMKQWNSATHVVHVFGHGEAIHSMASVKPKEVGEALSQAKVASGREADVLLLESCLMGNVESLNLFSDGAKVAVASETPLDFPIRKGQSEQHLLSPEGYARVAQEGGTPREVGSHFLREAQGQRFQQETLASFDLKAVSAQLVPGLDALGSRLQTEVARGGGKVINECFDSTASVAPANGLLDLGSFLDQLSQKKESFEPATQAALEHAQGALQNSVLEYHASPDGVSRGLTGMSFLDSRLEFQGPDGQPVEVATGMPAGWTALGTMLAKELQQPAEPTPPTP